MAVLRNGWFTPGQMRISLRSLAEALHPQAIDRWIAPYEDAIRKGGEPRSVLLILPGNIPFAGAQDILAVLLSGHRALIKSSSRDERSIPRLLDVLKRVDERFQERVEFLDEPIGRPDAVIATGSENSGRYFDWYFGHLPHSFRGDRNGVAILEGDESEEELKGLMDDMLLYFGLGCRNVSKLYVPRDWDPTPLLKLLEAREDLKEHQKYMNNYAYHKAIYYMNGERFYDASTMLLKEEQAVASPLGTLFYETYEGEQDLERLLKRDEERVQCIVSRRHVPFGRAQFPALGEHEPEKDPLTLLADL